MKTYTSVDELSQTAATGPTGRSALARLLSATNHRIRAGATFFPCRHFVAILRFRAHGLAASEQSEGAQVFVDVAADLEIAQTDTRIVVVETPDYSVALYVDIFDTVIAGIAYEKKDSWRNE